MLGTAHVDLSRPLEVERVGKGGLKYPTVLTRRHLTAGERETDPASEFFGRPKVHVLTTAPSVQVPIHPSRLVLFYGNREPDDGCR